MLFFNTDGDVRSCCMNSTHPIGKVTEQRLPEIWAGQRRRNLIEHLRDDDYSLGCQACDRQGSVEGHDAAYARSFDAYAPDVAAMPADDQWPVRLEFNLSNSCNLQCVQCHGGLSSSIRIHREKLPALPKVYDERFFADVVPFLTHAKDIQVAGGEPFLGAESLRLFDLMAEHATQARCSVVTNATQWNRRVEQILEAVPMSITVSIDGISKDVYESIRVGSDLDQVLLNIDRFVDYAGRRATNVWFNHCLMVQNYHEFADLLLFAETRGIRVNVQFVYWPTECSLADLDADALGRVCDELESQSATVLPQLTLNAHTWTDELARLRQWHRFQGDSGDDKTLVNLASEPSHIFGLNQWGSGPTDEGEKHDRLRQGAPDRAIHSFTIGAGDQIRACSPGGAESLGLTEGDLVGETGDTMRRLMEARFGEITGAEILDQTDDHIEQVITYGTTPFRATVVALRDDGGWAEEVRLLFVAPSAPAQS